MLAHIAYLAACAEDTLFRNTEIMTRISIRLRSREENSKLISALNAIDLVNYLIEYQKQLFSSGRLLIKEEEQITPFDLTTILSSIKHRIQQDYDINKTINAINLLSKGTKVNARVLSKNNGGLVCSLLDEGMKGFTAVKNAMYALPHDVYETVQAGSVIECEIIEYNYEYNSFELKFLRLSMEKDS